MSDIKLVALDMDGTLLCRGTVSPANRQAITDCLNAGVQVAVASGRIVRSVLSYWNPVGLPAVPIIAANGSCVLDAAGNLLHEARLPSDAVMKLWDIWQEAHPHWMGGRLTDSLYLYPHEEGAMIWGREYKQSWEPGQELEDVLCRSRDDIAKIAGDLYKIVVTNRDTPEIFKTLRPQFNAIPGLSVTSSWASNLEIMPAGIHKGFGVQVLCRALGITPDQAMAMGDNENDLEMLECVGLPVIMGNAAPAHKERFQHIAPPHDQDGVAWAINKFVLGR